MRGLQLPLVIHSAEAKFVRSFGINPVLLQRPRQRMGLAILIQMNPDSAHGSYAAGAAAVLDASVLSRSSRSISLVISSRLDNAYEMAA